MITVGIDVGSISTKAALVDADGRIQVAVMASGYNARQAGKAILETLLAKADVRPEGIDRIVATGYGRNSVDLADQAITEITCHATGAHYQNSQIRSVIDIGGQDSKAIVLNDQGRVQNFAMNDKCAAGTGRFLEVMARALEVDLDRFGKHSLEATSPAAISSLCTVFAESEVIGLIAKGAPRADIIAGIHESIAARVTAMAGRVGVRPPIMMTGGVARNQGVVQALEQKLGQRLEVTDYAQFNGALGAALLARKTQL